jgi:two-component system nitrate/nitrite response regulator NarL
MHTCALLEESKRVAQSECSPLAEAFRSLLSLLERTDRLDVEGSANGNQTEQVLVDTEVDGNRYLVIRMPRSLYNRVQLSPREQEIVRMVAQGHPNKVIADVLNISAWTVCTHLRRIFAKLGVGSRAAMVAQLLELGVIRKDYQLHAHHR